MTRNPLDTVINDLRAKRLRALRSRLIGGIPTQQDLSVIDRDIARELKQPIKVVRRCRFPGEVSG